MRKTLTTVAAALVASAPLATAWGGEAAPGLADMLRMIPPSERTWRGWQIFSYVDYRAVEAAAGLPHADTEVALGDGAEQVFADWPVEQREAWRANLRRVSAGPHLLNAYGHQIGSLDAAMVDTVGVDFFAIDRAMVFWEQPAYGSVQVLAGDPPIADLGAMRDWSDLFSRGFLLSDIDGVPVWHRYEDNEMAFSLIDRSSYADPLDGDMNASVRLAVLPDRLVVAQQWPDLDAVLPRGGEDAPETDLASLIEAMTSAALTLEGVGSRVLQASAVSVADIGVPRLRLDRLIEALPQDGEMPEPAELEALMNEGRPQGPPLPPYPLALFLDLQAGNDQVNAIALPYPDRETAELAARTLSDRLSVWTPGDDAAFDPLVVTVDGTVETVVQDAPGIGPAIIDAFLAQALANADETEAQSRAARIEEMRQAAVGDDGAVAVVAVRYPMPAGAGRDDTLGLVLRVWLISTIDDGFAPLATP